LKDNISFIPSSPLRPPLLNISNNPSLFFKIKSTCKLLDVDIFPNYEMLGWYTTGSTVLKSDLETHKGMTDLNPNPIMLTLDPNPNSEEESLPVQILETQVTGNGESVFVQLDYSVETLEPERICVDHIANQKVQTDNSPLADHCESLKSALTVMRERITAIQLFLADVRSGRQVAKPALLRRIASLCHLLPAGGSSVDFQAALLNEANDSSLMTYLSELTNIACSIKNTKSQVISTFGSNDLNMRGKIGRDLIPMSAFSYGGGDSHSVMSGMMGDMMGDMMGNVMGGHGGRGRNRGNRRN
jgi:hypothetical protein